MAQMAMKLIEIFLPLADNRRRAFPDELFARIRREMSDRFGGVTCFTRAPAHGVSEDDGKSVHDDIIVMEVLTGSLDRAWWHKYREMLEREFRQNEILIRVSDVEKL